MIWLMVLKMSLGSVMAMPIQWSWAEPAVSEVSATTSQTVHHPVHLATLPECHGHATSHVEVKGHQIHPTSVDTDAPSGNPIDCHHCCAVGLDSEPCIALHRAPATHPTSPRQDWQSANLRPVLRPPII
ncbi:hypothetical protein H663_020325 [Limnohabitans planktonicus II-D5]|uniref:Secreted protein n=1 Tax=Limnohabitans planktonicus II-D5 TaxID=1293045 RepID=A0A2T7SS25_9BURK|nr:hypothetical protein H663_020325 [Limnohabitans planktonicus II-D5]